MVVTSSTFGIQYCPGLSIYSATKAFGDFIAHGLNYEFKGIVDVMSYTAGPVDTNFVKGSSERKKNFMVISSDVAAETCFRDLGFGP